MYFKGGENMNKDLFVNPGKLTIGRARACMSVETLAKAANVSRDTITRIYRNNGKPVKVTCTTAGKLARALGVDVLDIIEN